MREELLCINSDAVNRYGYMVHITAMEKSLKEVFDKGMPLLIGHDFHRPIGWSLPFALFIESHLARMIARKIVATNKEELITIRNSVQNFLERQYHERFVEFGKDFLQSLAPYLSGNETRIDTGCLAVIDDDIAVKLFEDLFKMADDDGLVPMNMLLKDFVYLSQGVFKHQTSAYCLFAHQFFRRSQSRFNNFHYFFLDAFMHLMDQPECQLKIRLDRDMIGLSSSFHERGELEFHYGPKYTDDISQIKHGIARFQTTAAQRRYHNISATEFYWKKDKTEMTFELEELKDDPSPSGDELYHCRYVHSIYEKKMESFVHFDGAMRSYSLEEMTTRIDKDFVEYGRKGHYKKLFRIDGKLALADWKSLVTHYLQGNPLIYEYFGLKEEIESFQVNDRLRSPYEKMLPFDIKKEEGLRIMISYHAMPEDLKSGRYIDVYDVMASETEKIYCVEHMVTEVKNAFRQAGENFELRDDITYIKFDDPFWNIPSILHHGENVQAMVQKSAEVIASLLKTMLERNVQTFISLTLSFTFNNRLVRLSSYGHIEHQVNWLENNFPFEWSEQGLTNWVEKQRDELNRFSINTDSMIMEGLLQIDGILFIKRVPVEFPYTYEINDTGIQSIISFPAEDDASLHLLNENKITPVICTRVEKALWSDTGEDYFTATRSKWMNNTGAYVELHQVSPLALYWSKPFSEVR